MTTSSFDGLLVIMLVDLDRAAKILLGGGVVAFPTETVYGLGAVATDRRAIEKVYQIKNRPLDNPLICHFYGLEQIKEYVPDLPKIAELIFQEFAPGPISLLVPLSNNSPLLPATAGLPSVIARMPNHPLTLELLRRLRLPLAGPSANTSGKFSGTDPEMIEKDLGSKIDGILDGGQSNVGLESTILDCRRPQELKILRQGAIGDLELETFLHQQLLNVFKLNQKTNSTNSK